MHKVPLWLKILVMLILASIVLSPLAAVSEYLVPLVLIIGLILFPGKKPDRPILVVAIPWFWSLEFMASVGLLVAHFMGKQVMPAGAHEPTDLELMVGIVCIPPLVYSLLKKQEHFRKVLLTASVVTLTVSVLTFASSPKDLKDALSLFGDVSTWVLLSVYLYLKVPGKKADLA